MTLLLAFSVRSATIQCGGMVEKVGFHSPDKLMLKLSSMNRAVYICSPEYKWTVSGTSYSTGPKMCQTMMSMLMHAKATRSDMGSIWFDGDDVPENCESWGAMKKANIRYFAY
ncbi:hypothetical protein L1D51_12115 [Pseudoalteromonas shioyasakiensis]|uniref:hypothetical protein n=1 Tax=Pseudoalteromonas shioyasakiensis TaxID=1190813 RepID=UPI001EFC309F|nr:hypothetical protein [Pseudoalteromonas shioyasakiensis]MCG9734738.1 hypothetical protein [Pseudoalteromonas shioyasakiensis]